MRPISIHTRYTRLAPGRVRCGGDRGREGRERCEWICVKVRVSDFIAQKSTSERAFVVSNSNSDSDSRETSLRFEKKVNAEKER